MVVGQSYGWNMDIRSIRMVSERLKENKEVQNDDLYKIFKRCME